MVEKNDCCAVAWCGLAGGQAAILAAATDVDVRFVAHDTQGDPQVEAAVLDVRAFAGLEALEAAAGRFEVPVLWVVRAAELDWALARLRGPDDVCLVTAPAALRVHRARRLALGAHRRDALTGLRTRSEFVARMQRAEENADQSAPVSLVLIDIDLFKAINDQHGHAFGDRVLRELGQRIEAVAPVGSLTARIGGEELAILLDADEERALAVADDALGAVRADLFSGVPVTVSIGVGTAHAGGSGLFRQADDALYGAKAQGRDRVVHFVDLQREALAADGDVALRSFEDRVRVLADHVVETLTRRGRRIFDELKTQADLDSLTGLYSRRYYDRRLPFEFGAAVAEGHPITLALIDIDDFGLVNKRYGWPTGDRVLAEVSERVKRSVRDSDWVARYGGEEICVVLFGTRLAQAGRVLERIRTAVAAAPFAATDGRSVSVTISIGAAERREDEGELPDMVERVSARLLRAKKDGKNCVRL